MVADRDQLAELARKAALGDSHAFRQLVVATTDLVYRVALRTVGTSADAEDVVQDTFVRAWQKLSTLNDPAAVAGWLCRIARNIGTDKLRARKNRPTVFGDDDTARIAVERLVSDAPGAETLINSTETAAVVRAALEQVDEKFRIALLLKDVDGLPAATIATMLDIPVGTVESRASRGRDQLGKVLARFVKAGKL